MVDRQADLELMRRKLLLAFGEAEPGQLPSLCKELRAVNLELASLGPSVSAGQRLVDDLRERRAARRPGA
jgi:hypothetical protein